MKNMETANDHTPEIQPPVKVPDNPPSAPNEIEPKKDPDQTPFPPEIEPVKPVPEIKPEK